MELRQLRAFVKAAEFGHFGQAATQLHQTQSALSKQIQELEASLGVHLFQREGRGIRITTDGELLLSRAEHILAQAASMMSQAKALERGELGRLRLGFSPVSGIHLLPQLLRRLQRKAPGIELELIEAPSDRQLELLSQGNIDAGLLRGEVALATTSGLQHHILQREPFVVCVPKQSPLAHRRSLRLTDLASACWIEVAGKAPGGTSGILRNAWSHHGGGPPSGLTVSQVPAALALVAAGVGISILPKSARNFRVSGVKYIRLTGGLESTIVVSHLSGARSGALALFIAACGGTVDEPAGSRSTGRP